MNCDTQIHVLVLLHKAVAALAKMNKKAVRTRMSLKDATSRKEPLRILLIEDSETDVLLLKRQFDKVKRQHYEIKWATSSADALEKCTDQTFDACLTDFRLGRETGLEVLQSLNENYPALPVIRLTGLTTPESDQQASDVGAADFLDKNELTPQLLERSIRYAIANRAALMEVNDAREGLEEKVRERTADLAEAMHAAELANKAKSAFLANMSHELRTPLNAIMGFAEVVKMSGENGIDFSKLQEYLGHIVDSGVHLESLISDILELSSIESGNFKIREETVDLADLADAGISQMAARAEEQGVALLNSVPDELPSVSGDNRALKQVILNLISNGLDYTGEAIASPLPLKPARPGFSP